MAEKSPPKKKSSTAVKQEVQKTLADMQAEVQERREASMKPEERIEERNVSKAVDAADALFAEGVVKGVSDLRQTLGRILGQLSEKLEVEIDKYGQIKKAIDAKEKELVDIYEIQKNASTLTALVEAQERRRDEFEADMEASRTTLTREIETTRADWDRDRKQREVETRERDAVELKKREREREEYRYAFAREQQLAKDEFADQTSSAEKVLTDKTARVEADLSARESAIKLREEEQSTLRQQVAGFPKELDAALIKAVKDALARAQVDGGAREELLRKEFQGERNVLTTRIASLEQTTKEQAEQITKLLAQAEKAYAQVQDIAVKAIEGSSGAKSLASLQQMFADQSRRTAQEK